MAKDQSNTAVVDDDVEDDKEARKPYVVVLMSAEMKDALKKYASEHDTNPTALARELLAAKIGYDISNEPQPTRRSVYTSDEERADAKKLASKKSGLLRKALFQVHMGQLKNKPALLMAANAVVLDLSTPDRKPSVADLEAWDKVLDDAIKAGK